MKRALLIFVLLVLVSTLAGLFLFLQFGLEPTINKVKPDIENTLSRLLKKEISINGPIEVSLIPHMEIVAHDLVLNIAHTPFLKIDRLAITANSWPLQKETLVISTITANRPRLHLQGLKDTYQVPAKKAVEPSFFTPYISSLSFFVLNGLFGQFSLEKNMPLNAVKVGEVNLDQGNVLSTNSQMQKKLGIEDLQLTVTGINIMDFADLKAGWRYSLKKYGFSGEVSAKSVQLPKVDLRDIYFQAHNQQGILGFSKISALPITGAITAELQVDTQHPEIGYNLDLALTSIKIEPLLTLFNSKITATGQLEIRLNAASHGTDLQTVLPGLNGDLAMKGENLTLSNLDIDGVLENYQKSQSLDLFDIGAFVLAGPLGLLATKTLDVSSMAVQGGSDEKSTIPRLQFDWKIQGGVAETADVAFASLKHRVAAKGKLDLTKQQFEEMEIALLNESGCIEFSQSVRGPIKDPEVGAMSFVGKVLVSPIAGLAKKVTGLFTDKCDIFYTGTVPHPNPDSEKSSPSLDPRNTP